MFEVKVAAKVVKIERNAKQIVIYFAKLTSF